MVTQRDKKHRLKAKTKFAEKEKTLEEKTLVVSDSSEQESCCDSSHCENCQSHRPQVSRKPMYKLGSWKGAFSGTPDF